MSSSPYQPAATLLNQLWEETKKRKSLKSLAFDAKTGELKCSKTTYAQVCHVQKHLATLQAVWEKHTAKNSPATIQNEGLLYVLLYELLLGPNQSIRGGGQLKRQLTKEESKLRNYLQQIQSLNGEESIPNHEEEDDWPRYIRVNTCQSTTQQVVDTLQSILSESDFKIYLDAHVPNLLVVPPQATPLILGSTSSDTKWNPQTSVVLQDKSSCFPALCLMSLFDANTKSSFELIDACAAPGNKTTHLAALATDFCKQQKHAKISIHAFDRDTKRHELLQRRCQALVGGDMIQTKQQDFLTVDPNDYPNVRGILLDPTCSGSGMRDQLQSLKRSTDEDEERLEKLSFFQYKALKHACSFPQVEFIVYSTCSVNVEENEAVVHRVLSEVPWNIVPPPALVHWKRRGHSKNGEDGKNDADRYMIRVDPTEDETNGFFVCCLARSNPDPKSKLNDSAPRNSIQKQAKALGLPVYTPSTIATMAKDKKEKQQVAAQAMAMAKEKRKHQAAEPTKPFQAAKKDQTKEVRSKENSAKSSASDGTLKQKALSKTKKEKRQLTEESPQNAKKKPRTSKATEPKETTRTHDATDKEHSMEDNKHAKKRAKRLEWKQKQREAKMKRLQVTPKK